MNHTYSVLFWVRNQKISKKTGEAPIVARITVNGKRAELTTGKKIDPEKWNINSGRVRGNGEGARIINRQLNNIQLKLDRIHDKLDDQGCFISAQAIKSTFLGKNTRQHLLLALFEYHNGQIKEQIGKGYSKGTYLRYETTIKHTREFIQSHYGKEDVYFNELQYEFITEFEFFLKSKKEISHNTVIRYLKIFKKIVLLALKNEWIDRDPFSRYKMTMKEVKKGYLTKEELEIIYHKEFSVKRLEQVRDIFLFCCYTGLSYADVRKLTSDNISKGLDGEYWVFVDRTKTGAPSNVPLLPIAKEIIDRYVDHPKSNKEDLLPIVSNQKMNAYLKEMSALCRIEKDITFHMARHTFATTVTLSNGVSLETVSSMLGHKNIKTTQIYAKVVQEKVSQDMKILKEKLGATGFGKVVNQ